MATPTTTQRACKNCGTTLPDRPLSICPYCVMPIQSEGAPAGVDGESPQAARIERVLQHDTYPAALDASPAETPTYWKAKGVVFRGKLLAGFGLALVVLGLGLNLSDPAEVLTSPIAILGVLAAVFGVTRVMRGNAAAAIAVEKPLLKRAGMILDRRSDTAVAGWSGHTVYHFTIEFEGGIVGEFRWEGRGTQEEPYVSNLPGVAYTRGDTLLGFKHIRV